MVPVIFLLMALLTGCASWHSGPSWLPGSKRTSEAEELPELTAFNDPDKRKDSGIDVITRSIKEVTGLKPDEKAAQDKYDKAEQLFQQATQTKGSEQTDLFLEAAELFAGAAKGYPDSLVEEDGIFMEGESYFFADKYPKAIKAYDELIKKYQKTRHLDTVEARRFAIAQYWLQLHAEHHYKLLAPNMVDRQRPIFDTFGHAIKQFEQIRLEDPTGKLADDATMAAGVACFQEEHFERAEHFFSDLRQSFPKSPHQFKAHLLGMKCQLELYQGYDYGAQPLETAQKLIETMQKQFPEELSQYQQYLADRHTMVTNMLAERDWKDAQRYDGREWYGSARLAYAYVIKKYPTTKYAEQARERLVQIKDKPERPDEPLQWLADLFPESEESGPLLAAEPSSEDTKR